MTLVMLTQCPTKHWGEVWWWDDEDGTQWGDSGWDHLQWSADLDGEFFVEGFLTEKLW